MGSSKYLNRVAYKKLSAKDKKKYVLLGKSVEEKQRKLRNRRKKKEINETDPESYEKLEKINILQP